MYKRKLPNKKFSWHLLAIVSAYIIWAAAGPIIKLTLDYIPVFTFLLYRFIIVCIAVLPYTIIKLKQYPIHKEDIIKILLLGLFSQTSLALIFFGFKYTTALEGTIIGVLGPILSVFAGHHLYNEKVNNYVKLGLGIATFGTFIVVLEPIFASSSDAAISQRLLGNMFVVMYTLMFLMYILWSKMSLGITTKPVKKVMKFFHMKPMKRHYPATLLMTLAFYVGLLTFIPLAIIETSGFFGEVPFQFSNLTLVPLLGILYMALISSVIAYVGFEWGLSKIEIKETAIFSYMQPIFAVPFAYLLLGEIPEFYVIVGGLIIALGVVIAEYKKS